MSEGALNMGVTFTPEEIIQANQFRTLSQKSLQQELQVHEKLGVYFPSRGVSAVMLTYDRYKTLVESVVTLQEALEDAEIALAYGDRENTPDEAWMEHPEGASTLKLYRKRRG